MAKKKYFQTYEISAFCTSNRIQRIFGLKTLTIIIKTKNESYEIKKIVPVWWFL
jgi:hypothetical protein